MLIFPAIDLKDGQVVRLKKGDFSTVHQVASDPVAVVEAFYASGARHLHMVDLDGARDGKRKNSEIVRRTAQCGLAVELGGGIRSMEDIEAVFALGVHRAVIGSAAVSDPDLVREAVLRWGGARIAVGVDAKDGKVRTAGWETDSGLPGVCPLDGGARGFPSDFHRYRHRRPALRPVLFNARRFEDRRFLPDYGLRRRFLSG